MNNFGNRMIIAIVLGYLLLNVWGLIARDTKKDAAWNACIHNAKTSVELNACSRK